MPRNHSAEAPARHMCGKCGNWFRVSVENYEQYRISDDYDTRCTDFASSLNKQTSVEITDEGAITTTADDLSGHASSAYAENQRRKGLITEVRKR